MNWIQKILGITEIINQQKQTNKLLEEVIKLQKHDINNDCSEWARKQRV